MIKNICGEEYFCVEVSILSAMKKSEEKEVKTEADRARKEAIAAGYKTDTQQQFTDNGKQYYTFHK